MVLDLGMTVGKVDLQNTCLKVKLGKGSEEAKALNKIVEEGTGKALDESKHQMSFRIEKDADPSQLLEMLEGMCENTVITQVDGATGGKWITVNLTEVAGDSLPVGDLEAQLDQFFADCPQDSYLEFGFNSSKTFNDALAVAKEQNEGADEVQPPSETALPSFVTFMESMEMALKCDISHEFALSVLSFVGKMMGLPLDANMFQFIKKFQCFEARWNFNSVAELQDGDRMTANKFMWEPLGDAKALLGEVEPFVSLFNELTMFFTLRDSAFLKLEFRAPGLSEYTKYMGSME